jgi:hypothetical protein
MTTDHPTHSFSQAKADDFANRLLTMLNHSSLCVMISIGHRTRLFDTMSNLQPSSSAEIASKAGLNERYVREWLGAMVSGGVVELDPNTNKFSLPAEHAAALTRAAGANNMAVFTQYIGLMGTVEDDIVECFYKGGGVPYSRFPRFHEVMAEDSGQSFFFGKSYSAARCWLIGQVGRWDSNARCWLRPRTDHESARSTVPQ